MNGLQGGVTQGYTLAAPMALMMYIALRKEMRKMAESSFVSVGLCNNPAV